MRNQNRSLHLLTKSLFRVGVPLIFLAGLALAQVRHAPRDLLLRLQKLAQSGDLTAAHKQLDAAIKEFPSEPGLYNLRGTVEVQQKNLKAAEADFRKALAVEPDFTGASLNLGRL